MTLYRNVGAFMYFYPVCVLPYLRVSQRVPYTVCLSYSATCASTDLLRRWAHYAHFTDAYFADAHFTYAPWVHYFFVKVP